MAKSKEASCTFQGLECSVMSRVPQDPSRPSGGTRCVRGDLFVMYTDDFFPFLSIAQVLKVSMGLE